MIRTLYSYTSEVIRLQGSYVNNVSESVDGEPVVEMYQYRLDGLVADDVMLMKIDCEGCEGGALRGAEKLFEAKKVKFVVVEIFPELMGFSDTDGKVVSKGMGISDTASTLKYLMVTHGFKCLWERNGLMFGHDIDGSINQLVRFALLTCCSLPIDVDCFGGCIVDYVSC